MRKYILLYGSALLLFSIKSQACMTFPKSIALNGSPFMFKKIEIGARVITINDAKGNPVRITCDREKKKWKAQFTEDDGRITEQDFTNETITDSNEIPVRTKIQFFSSGEGCLPRFDALERCDLATGPYFTVKDPNSDKAMVFHCTQEKADPKSIVHNIEMSVSIYSHQKQIAKTSVTEMTGVRGIGPTHAADGTIDLNSSDYNEIKFAGCGVGSSNSRSNSQFNRGDR